MDFHYKNYIEPLNTQCPPSTYKEINRLSYRWVFDTIGDANNFRAQAEKNPKILNDKNDLEICDYYALSFHISKESSRNHFKHFLKGSPMAYKRLGTNIAEGKLELTDGVGGPIDLNDHFNFHHVKDVFFANRFKIIEKL